MCIYVRIYVYTYVDTVRFPTHNIHFTQHYYAEINVVKLCSYVCMDRCNGIILHMYISVHTYIDYVEQIYK